MIGPPDRLVTALADRYRIERELGAGGMATVYLADDLKHDRRVALKVLKPELAAVVGAERFVAEIRTTANLQHPHILPLFDSGEADGFLYYVMPYVEGESLRERLDREKQLPIDEAVAIATKVAGALEHAHEAGVIHRDIKPANILLNRGGEPLVADFGIALAVQEAGGGRLTETGLSLGTPYYMSPEQATGDRDPDARSDVYALGAVLYEMLVGEPPFVGGTAQAVLGKILTGNVTRPTEVRKSIPANVEAAVLTALERLPADRFAGASGLVEALRDASFRGFGPAVGSEDSARPSASGRGILPWVTAAALVVLTVVAAWGWMQPDPPVQVLRADLALGDIVLAEGERVEVSPTGDAFAFAGIQDGVQTLFVRRAHEDRFRPLPGTEEGRHPAFSPDGFDLAYVDGVSDNTLLRVSIDGGRPTVVAADVPGFAVRPSWGEDGTIVFTGSEGVFRVAATGGSVESIWNDARGGTPRSLPGGRGVLLTRGGAVMVQEPGVDSVRTLVAEGVDARWIDTGHLLFSHPAGGLRVVPFDLDGMRVTGPSTPVLDDVGAWASRSPNVAFFSMSDDGTLVFVTGRGEAVLDQRLVEFDLESRSLQSLPIDPRRFRNPRYAPDGRRIAFAAEAGGSPASPSQLWVWDSILQTEPALVTAGNDPVWSPAGDRLALAVRSDRFEGRGVAVASLGGVSEVDTLVVPEGPEFRTQIPLAWSGDRLLYRDTGDNGLWVVDPARPVPTSYLDQEGRIVAAAVSPDDRWMAYQTVRNQRREIWVREFTSDQPGPPLRVGDGEFPLWSSDGLALFVWTETERPGDFALHRIPVRVVPTPEFGAGTELLRGAFEPEGTSVHPDGSRLLLTESVSLSGPNGAVEERVVVVTHWLEELRARLEEGR